MVAETRHAAAARHTRGATKSTRQLAWAFLVRGRLQYLPLLLSDYGCQILKYKYDAFSTDRAYENRPSGALGPVGRLVDRLVLNFPTHEGLRQRLAIVSSVLVGEIERRVSEGEKRVRVLSAPCGLARDVITAGRRLRAKDSYTPTIVEFHALDLDERGDVIPEAARRAAAARVDVRFYREDLFNSPSLMALLGDQSRFEIVNCIGLAAWLDLPDVQRLTSFFQERLLDLGGTLIVDNFSWHRFSALGRKLEMNTRYHPQGEFVRAIEETGFRLRESRPTANGVNTVYVFVSVGRSGRS